VTLFWILVCVVVPAALFRIGMAVVDRLRPRGSSGRAGRFGGGGGGRAGRPGRGAHGVRRGGLRLPEVTLRMPKSILTSSTSPEESGTDATTRTRSRTNPTLPWFTPDTDPGAAEADPLSAPHENSPTTPTRKGNT